MNQSEFRTFYQTSYPHLWRYLSRMVTDTDLASDLAQDSFMRFLRSAPGSRSEKNSRAYLFSIATNLVKDHWRRGAVHGKWMDETDNSTVDDSASELPLRLDLASALEKLSLMHRSLLWLVYVEGYSHDEVAAIQQIQPTSVRVLLMRARRRLADICREMGIEKESHS